MNPDQNIPTEQPASTAASTDSQVPVQQIPVTDLTSQPVSEAPVEPTAQPVDPATPGVTPTPNPFSAQPVSSEAQAPNPFGGQPVDAPATTPGPTASTDTAVAGAPITPPAGPSKKKLIVLISGIVGGLLVLGGAALAVFLIFFSVSHDDYVKAYNQVKAVSVAVSDTDVTGTREVDQLTASLEEYKTQNAKLADLKALNVDKDLSEKYKAYDVKAKAYIAFADAFIPSYGKLKTVTDSVLNTTSLKSSSIQATITLIEDAGDVSDPTIKEYIDTLLKTYQEILPQVKIYETATSSTEKTKALNAISTASKALTTAADTFQTDLQDRYDSVSPSDAFDALSKAVTDKANAR